MDGPATLRLAPAQQGWRVMAWGPGSERAVAHVPRLLGGDDDPTRLVLPRGPLHDLAARLPGLRFGRTDAVLRLARAGHHRAEGHRLSRRGGPIGGWSRATASRHPDRAACACRRPPRRLAALPSHELHPLGLEQRRALTLGTRSPAAAARLEAAVTLPHAEALARLRAIPGVGAWTAAETARAAFGDPDAREPGRLPPAAPGGLGARRRATGRRRSHARAAGALPRPAGPRGAPPGALRHPTSALRPAHAGSIHRATARHARSGRRSASCPGRVDMVVSSH